jgi:hypothetical protein
VPNGNEREAFSPQKDVYGQRVFRSSGKEKEYSFSSFISTHFVADMYRKIKRYFVASIFSTETI